MSEQLLNLINAECGPGDKNDAQFVSKLASLIWGDHELAKRSVTGSASNVYKNAPSKPGLEKDKLKFIYGI